MDPVVEALWERGGCARLADLCTVVSAARVRAAVARGVVLRLRHGTYCLPELADDRRRAAELGGVLTHLSAAAHWGWSLKFLPRESWVAIPPKRHLRASVAGVRLVWRSYPANEIIDGVLEPLRTVIECARDLPFDEALTVADSALRVGAVTRRELQRAAERVRGPGSATARRVADSATKRAANPLESALRAICLSVPGLAAEPQFRVEEAEVAGDVDLADPALRLVIEAEGFETHGTRKGFDKDIHRYTALSCAGWLVLRFTWTQVMFQPEWVRARIIEAVALQRARLDRNNFA